MCVKFGDSTHTVGKATVGGGQYTPLASHILSFFVNKSNGLSGFPHQSGHKSRINRRILAIIARIMDMAAGGVLGWWLVDMLGVRALPLLIAAPVVTLAAGFALRLMLWGDK